MATKFKTMSISAFKMKHDEANDALQEEDITTLPPRFGEVKTDNGWYPCVLGENGNPSYFYDEDDGWQPVPPFIFEKCESPH